MQKARTGSARRQQGWDGTVSTRSLYLEDVEGRGGEKRDGRGPCLPPDSRASCGVFDAGVGLLVFLCNYVGKPSVVWGKKTAQRGYKRAAKRHHNRPRVKGQELPGPQGPATQRFGRLAVYTTNDPQACFLKKRKLCPG